VANALINVPARARRGEIIEIKTLVSHPMETGYRRTQLGAPIPRDIIRRFVCTYNGTEVFSADLNPIRCMPAGCLTLDMRVRVIRRSARERVKTW